MKNSENAVPEPVEPGPANGSVNRTKSRKMSASSNIVDRIRRTLKEVAKKGDIVTYIDLARSTGKPDVQHWPELDALAQEEKRAGRPDLTLVVVGSKKPNLPSRFNGRWMDAEDWDQETLDLYCKRRNEVYEYYRAAR